MSAVLDTAHHTLHRTRSRAAILHPDLDILPGVAVPVHQTDTDRTSADLDTGAVAAAEAAHTVSHILHSVLAPGIDCTDPGSLAASVAAAAAAAAAGMGAGSKT